MTEWIIINGGKVNFFKSAPRKCFTVIILLQILATGVPAYAETPVEPFTGHTATTSEPAITGSGQTRGVEPALPDRITGEYVKDYFTDTGRIIASPVNWSGSDWLTAGLVIGATSGLVLADTEIRNFAQKNQSSAGDGWVL